MWGEEDIEEQPIDDDHLLDVLEQENITRRLYPASHLDVEMCIMSLMTTPLNPVPRAVETRKKPAATSKPKSKKPKTTISYELGPCDMSGIQPALHHEAYFDGYLHDYATKVMAIKPLFGDRPGIKQILVGSVCLRWVVDIYNESSGKINPLPKPKVSSSSSSSSSATSAGSQRQEEEREAQIWSNQEQDEIIDEPMLGTALPMHRNKSSSSSFDADNAGCRKPFQAIDTENLPLAPCWVEGCRLFMIKPLFAVFAAICWRGATMDNYRDMMVEIKSSIVSNMRTIKFYHCFSIPSKWSTVLMSAHPPYSFFKYLQRASPNNIFPVPDEHHHSQQWQSRGSKGEKKKKYGKTISCGCAITTQQQQPAPHAHTHHVPDPLPARLREMIGEQHRQAEEQVMNYGAGAAAVHENEDFFAMARQVHPVSYHHAAPPQPPIHIVNYFPPDQEMWEDFAGFVSNGHVYCSNRDVNNVRERRRLRLLQQLS